MRHGNKRSQVNKLRCYYIEHLEKNGMDVWKTHNPNSDFHTPVHNSQSTPSLTIS